MYIPFSPHIRLRAWLKKCCAGLTGICGYSRLLSRFYNIYILWYAADIFPQNLVWDRISSWYVVVWYCMFILGSRVWRIVIIRMGFCVMSIANSIANHWPHVSQHLAGYERTYRSAVVRAWLTWQHALGAHMFEMSNKQRDINQGSLHRGTPFKSISFGLNACSSQVLRIKSM